MASTFNGHSEHPGVYVSVEALLQLRHAAKDLCLLSNRRSIAAMDGDSRTVFRGRGMEFAEVRPYQAGDDVRNIDWRVTARTQQPYTKLFQEERERPVFLLVDQRSPMFFGSRRQFKSVLTCELAAIIAWTALQQNDRIGALIFSDSAQSDSRPRRGKHAALSVIHQLCDFNRRLHQPYWRPEQPALGDMLHELRRVAKPGSALYLLSDSHDFSEACREPLALLARHCDVTLIQIYDSLEWQLPAGASLAVSDGERKLALSEAGVFVERYRESFEAQRFALRKACHQCGVRFAAIGTETTAVDAARDLFAARRQRGGRTAS